MKRIKLTQGKFSIVDEEDFEELNKIKWHACYDRGTKSYYVKSLINNKIIHMPRKIMKTNQGLVVDHINHDTLDNRKSNLRNCTRSQNSMNQRKPRNNTSGTTGVYWKKSIARWVSLIAINQNQIYLGVFKDKNDAIKARKKAEIKYFGEFLYNG